MNVHSILRPEVVIAALLVLVPMLGAAFFPARVTALEQMLPRALFLLSPSLLCVPYALVAQSFDMFRWNWLALYALLPVAIAVLLSQARNADPGQKGDWRDFLVLVAAGARRRSALVGASVADGPAALGKMLLLDAGIFGFLAVRQTGWSRIRSASSVARPRHRAARVLFLCADRHLPGAEPALSAFPCSVARSRLARAGRIRLHVSLYCHSGGALLSRMAAEPAGAANWAAPRRWRQRRCSSVWRTGTNGPRASTGSMF